MCPILTKTQSVLKRNNLTKESLSLNEKSFKEDVRRILLTNFPEFETQIELKVVKKLEYQDREVKVQVHVPAPAPVQIEQPIPEVVIPKVSRVLIKILLQKSKDSINRIYFRIFVWILLKAFVENLQS